MPALIERYKEYLGARYVTFRWAFDEFVRIGGKTIVELGTTRSFVSGGVQGCMVNDQRFWSPDSPECWDWGAGMFTRVCGEHFAGQKLEIHSVDICEDAIQISRIATKEFSDLVDYHRESSETFLSRFPGKIDLLYMDAGETDKGADELHLREAKIVVSRELLSPKGIVLIDDVNIPGSSQSKGKYSIPFLSKQGFEIKIWDYQVILQAP